jgi:hypothetical protein
MHRAMDVARLLRSLLLGVLVALACSGQAFAAGGRYVVDGGTARERIQVRAALEASAFDWGVVRTTVRIHVRRGAITRSAPGRIWIDAALLDTGRYSWGYVQHEYAHQVDFFVLDGARRALLKRRLGGRAWWWDTGHAHGDYACERFASTLAWSYWSSKDNALRPKTSRDEAAAMAPGRFRVLMRRLLGAPRAELRR